MTWEDQPPQPAQAPPPTPMRTRGIRRGIVVGTMALGLLTLGGAAAVFAADPSASPSASASTTQPSATDAPSSTARPKGDCPDHGTTGGGGGSAPTTPDASPDASPNASSSNT